MLLVPKNTTVFKAVYNFSEKFFEIVIVKHNFEYSFATYKNGKYSINTPDEEFADHSLANTENLRNLLGVFIKENGKEFLNYVMQTKSEEYLYNNLNAYFSNLLNRFKNDFYNKLPKIFKRFNSVSN